MITPQDLCTAIKSFEVPAEQLRQEQFNNELSRAETSALENYIKLRTAGNPINHIRIKLDGEYPVNMVKAAVLEYIQAGWKTVSFNRVDRCPGSREPMVEWVITIKTNDIAQ